MSQILSTITHLLLLLIRHPEVLRKARGEIDRVVGGDRLPTFTDRPHLPYVDAVMNEVWRYSCPIPLGSCLVLVLVCISIGTLANNSYIGLPHGVAEDDVYRGKHIPKGSLVFGNIWYVHDGFRLYA